MNSIASSNTNDDWHKEGVRGRKENKQKTKNKQNRYMHEFDLMKQERKHKQTINEYLMSNK